MKNLNDGIVMVNKSILYVFVLVFVLGGCASMSESQQSTAKDTAMGTGAGAAVGAIIGAIAGDPALGAGIGAGVGAVGGYIWSNRMEEQKKKMEAATEGTQVSVTQTADNQLKLNVPSDISFDTGQSTIKPEMHPILNSLAAGLMSNPDSQVTIIGYTDGTGNDSINNPLSVNRAASTRAYLASQGIAINRISIDGRGASEPVATNTSPENRAKNRRVEIFVKEPQPQQQPQHELPQHSEQQQYIQQSANRHINP